MPRDFTSGIDDEDLMNTRANRNSSFRRPDIDIGMGEEEDDNWNNLGSSNDSDDGWGSSFGGMNDSFGNNDSFGGDNPFGGGSFGGGNSFGGNSFGGNSFGEDSFGGGNPFGGGNSFGGGGMRASGFGNPSFNGMDNMTGLQGTQAGTQNYEDVFWDKAAEKTKQAVNVISDLISSFKTFDGRRRVSFGRTAIIVGVVEFLIGLLLLPFGVEVAPLQMILMGGLTAGTGIIFFSVFYSAIPVEDNYPQQNQDFGNFQGMNQFPNFEEEEEEEEPEPEPPQNINQSFSNLFDEEEEEEKPILKHSGFSYNVQNEDEEDSVKDTNEVLNSIDDSNKAYMTRQFLYDSMINVMEVGNSNFSDVVELDEDSREFLTFAKYLEEAVDIVKKDKAESPELLKVEDKLFYTLLTISRPNWIKDTNAKVIMEEIVNQYAYDSKTAEVSKEISGSYNLIGKRLVIKIMKGENATITVRDIFKKKKDEILDSSMKMPVVLGVNQEGMPILEDLKNLHSFLFFGEPRSGKSWAVKSILAQLMMFNSPNEVQFYIVDSKGRTSDWNSLEVPHVREFVNTPEGAIKMLRFFCREEAERRSKFLFEQGNYKDIADFKKDHPEIDFPYIYVLIDEVLDLVGTMDKETRRVFFDLLKSFTSKLPSYGIRLMIVPHQVKNAIVDKTVTDMIPNRFCVRGDPIKINEVMGASEKEFPQKLAHAGDMAVHLQTVNSIAFFCHSAIVAKSNTGYDKFFDFLTGFWLKMNPESFKGSKLEYDLKMGLRQISEYPILSQGTIDLSSINRAKQERINNMPKRPRPNISKTIEPAYDIKEQEDSSNEDTKVTLDSNDINTLLNGVTDYKDDEEDIFI